MMGKITHISHYEQLTDEELIAEVQQRRREIQQPKLDARDRLSNFLISVPGIGGSIAMMAGLIHYITQPKSFSYVDKIQDYFANKKNNDKKTAKKELFSDPHFKRNVLVTAATFVVSSLVSLFVIDKIQRGERSEDNATKHLFGKDELSKRGYTQIDTGEFVKRSELAKMNNAAEKDNFVHKENERRNNAIEEKSNDSAMHL